MNRITIVLWILKRQGFGLIKYHTRNYFTKSTKQNPKSQAAPDANDLKLLSISRWCTKPILRIYNCVKAGPNFLDDDYAFIPQYNKIKNKLEFRYLHYRSTLSENIKLCPKIQFSEKCQNCEFEFLCQKLSKFNIFFLIFLLDKNNDFWRENSNYQVN